MNDELKNLWHMTFQIQLHKDGHSVEAAIADANAAIAAYKAAFREEFLTVEVSG